MVYQPKLLNMGNKPASGSGSSGGGGGSSALDRKGSKIPKKPTPSKNLEIQHIVKSPKNYVDMGIVEDDETAGRELGQQVSASVGWLAV